MFLMGMLIPVHSLLVPIYVVFNKTGLGNQWFTLIIPYVAFGMPIAVFLVEGFIKAIPVELEEAAAIDGRFFYQNAFFHYSSRGKTYPCDHCNYPDIFLLE